VQNAELRPLGAGELLDRAVTIFVRRFVPIVVVIALTLVPVTALSAIANPHAGQIFTDFGRMMGSLGDPVASQHAAEQLSQSDRTSGFAVAVVFITLVVRLAMWSAIVAVVAGAYSGSRVTVAQAYRIGLQRWLAQVIVALAFGVMGIVALIPAFIAYLLVVIAVAALAALHFVLATIIVGIVFGLAVLAAFAIVSAWVFMTYELASVAVVTEEPNPVSAISVALRRAFARGMKRRTIVGGLVVFAISQIGTLPLIGLAALLAAVTHYDGLYFAVFGAGSVLLEGLVAAFVVVFAVDVRVRREGLDILAAETPPAIA
jgi:hypothetical protein